MVKWYHTALWRRGSWFESRSGSASTRPSASLSTSYYAEEKQPERTSDASESKAETKMWYIYILECKDGKLYTGITDNLERRFEEHSTKKGGHYTKCNAPIKILYSEHFANVFDAAKREKQIKGWTRKKKLALGKENLVLRTQL